MPEKSEAGLAEIISHYPYFQTAHLLYLKNLHLHNSLQYPTQLKITAAYANDRKKLYKLVFQEGLKKKINIVEKETHAGENKKEDELKASPLEKQILQEAINASIQIEVTKGLSEWTPLEKTENKTKQSHPEIQETKNLSFNKTGKRTFNQWLQAINEDDDEDEEEALSNNELIDEFISPKAKPPQTGSQSNLPNERMYEKQAFFSPMETARLSIVDNEYFVTETLASIYEKQGNLLKALKAYEILSLKFPEKRSNFAARIVNLQNQIDGQSS